MKRRITALAIAVAILLAGVVLWRAAAAERAGEAQAAAVSAGETAAAAARATELPRAVAPQTEFDFGVFDVEQAGEHTFVVRNEGAGDLHLRTGSSSCKCTLLDLPQGTIPPGGEGQVRLEWIAPESNERFRHGATVLTDDPEQPQLLFVVSGRVRRHIAMYPPDVVVFSNVLPGQQRTHRALIYSEAYDAFELGEIESTHPYVTWDVLPMDAETLDRFYARSGYEIKIHLDSTEQLGRFGGHLALNLRVPGLPDDEQPRPRQLNVFSDVVGRVRLGGPDLDGQTVGFGLLTAGIAAQRTVLIGLAGEQRELNVREISATPDFLQVRLTPDGPGSATLSRYRLEIEVPADAAPCSYMRPSLGEVRIATDHPDLPELVLQVEFAIVPVE